MGVLQMNLKKKNQKQANLPIKEEKSSEAIKLEIEINDFHEDEGYSLVLVKSEESMEKKFPGSEDIHEMRLGLQNSDEEMGQNMKYEPRPTAVCENEVIDVNSSARQIELENYGYNEAVDAIGIESDEDWTDRFIQTIHGKPAIYDKGLKEHSDRHYVSQLWTEVGETMVPSWHAMTVQEKIIKAKEIQQRWRNIRTCFRREYNKQMKSKSGQSANKRRKYIYFAQLLFLLPTMEDKETVSECSPPQKEGDNSENEDGPMDEPSKLVQSQNNLVVKTKKRALFYEKELVNILREKKTDESDQLLSLLPTIEDKKIVCESSPPQSEGDKFGNENSHSPAFKPSIQSQNKLLVKSKKKALSYEEELLNILREKKADEIDEDRLFLLSLVPSFKKMTGAQKIEAKIEVLSVIKSICQ